MKTLKVLCVKDDAPYIYEENDEAKGMLVSILDDFAEQMGIRTEYAFCEQKRRGRTACRAEKIRYCGGTAVYGGTVREAGHCARETILDSTLAYAQNPMEEKRDTVATVRGMEEQLDLTGFKTVDFYDTALECVQAVKDGKADVAIGDRFSLNYYIYATNSALTMSAISGDEQKICVAISRECSDAFFETFNYYVYSLSNQDKTRYLCEANMQSSATALRHYVSEHPDQAAGVIAAATLLLVSAMFALIYARQMDRKNAQLSVANEAKNNFLTGMGHDIRTPMNGILGMIDLADKLPETTETIRDYHKKIRAATEELLSLVGDALDMSKLESKEAAFERESVSLRELLEDCRDRMEPRAAQSGILFTAGGADRF